MKADISVVLATFNGERFLEKQIKSILEQTLPPSKILVFDDRSSDKTIEILKSFDGNSSIEYAINHENKGVTRNFIDGILATETSYIALADQDDIWKRDKLERCYHTIKNLEAEGKPSIVFSDLEVIDANDQVVSASFWKELGINDYHFCFDTLLFGNFVTGCTILMDHNIRKYLSRIPVNLDIHDSWIALLAYSFGNASGIKLPLVSYRQHHNNITYSTSVRKRTIYSRFLSHLHFLMHPEKYLGHRFKVIQAFYETFQDEISEELAEKIHSFLLLKDQGYLKQKLAMRRNFKPHWN